ncbi:MAG TPA: hypothetical protein VNF75_08910 [Candidatus Dormibacteraeota bacterium]|nr:hypothetical protein [Candidatus Dormibacteraeota bacterium]
MADRCGGTYRWRSYWGSRDGLAHQRLPACLRRHQTGRQPSLRALGAAHVILLGSHQPLAKCDPYSPMRNPGSRELRRRQARLEGQQRTNVRERAQAPRRDEMMRRGGLLEGLSPSVVTRLALMSLVAGLVLIALAVLGLLIEIGQHDLFLGITVVLVAVIMAGTALSITAPAFQIARRDRKQAARNVQGQLVGASSISATPTLSTVAINVGKNMEQFRVRAELFERVKTGATVVGLTVTPGLNHVLTLTVIRRDRMAVMKEPPITRAMRISVWLPLISIASLIVGLALGCAIGVLLPLGNGVDHPLLTLVLAAAIAGVIALGTRWYSQRLVKQLGL